MLSITEYIGVIIEIAKNPTAPPIKIIKTGSIIADRFFVLLSTSFS
jgi:hypothetical protein